MNLSVLPIKGQKKTGTFDLFAETISLLETNQINLEQGDVLVISSKFISNAQGKIIDSKKVKPSEESMELSKKYKLNQTFAEVIVRESDFIFGGISGFVISSSNDILAPNAGIDKSNANKNRFILYPNDPYFVAEQLKRKLFLKFSKMIGIIIADSRLMPARVGTTGVAIACSGIEPLEDMRAKKDLHGNPLKVTLKAVADNLASIANHQMGEGNNAIPMAIVRNSGAKLTNRKISPNEMAISHDLCVYVRGFKNI